MDEHTKVPCSGCTCLCGASRFLVPHCLHRHLVLLTGNFFPISLSRTSSSTPLKPGLYFVRKSSLPLLFISWPTVSCITRASRPERQLVTLTTVVGSSNFYNCSQSQGQWESKTDAATIWLSASQFHIFLVCGRSDLLPHYCIVICKCGRSRNNRCSFVSPKWLVWDCGTWTGLSQGCCPATLLLPHIL